MWLLKLQLLKQSIKIHLCVVNRVVMWLQILGPYWCLKINDKNSYPILLFAKMIGSLIRPQSWHQRRLQTIRRTMEQNV